MRAQLVTIAVVLSLFDTALGQSSGQLKCQTQAEANGELYNSVQTLSSQCRADDVADKVGTSTWGSGPDGSSPCKAGATKCTLHLKPRIVFGCEGDTQICGTDTVMDAIATANAKSTDVPVDLCIPTVCVNYADIQKADVMFAKNTAAAMCRLTEGVLLGSLDATAKNLITESTTSTAEMTCEGDNPITTMKPTATPTPAPSVPAVQTSFARSPWSWSSASVLAGFGVALLQ